MPKCLEKQSANNGWRKGGKSLNHSASKLWLWDKVSWRLAWKSLVYHGRKYCSWTWNRYEYVLSIKIQLRVHVSTFWKIEPWINEALLLAHYDVVVEF